MLNYNIGLTIIVLLPIYKTVIIQTIIIHNEFLHSLKGIVFPTIQYN